MKPNMLTHLATSNVKASTYLRAWYIAYAKRVVRKECWGDPRCGPGRSKGLADWLERRARAPWQA